MNPDFTYYLWTWKNVTRKNFPLTYDRILKFISLSKKYKTNFLVIASHIMRIELLYKYGGFYMDFKIEGKKPL
jgi:mannosyltransferase OCH1-like enzyme